MAFKQVYNPKYRLIFITALGIIIMVLVNWLINLYSPDTLKNYFGDDYKLILLLITVLFILFLFLLTHKQENNKTRDAPETAVSKDMIPDEDYAKAYQKLKTSLAYLSPQYKRPYPAISRIQAFV